MWQAWADDRMDDVVATLDPAVTWTPSTRCYDGHEGVRQLRRDAISVHGSYWISIPTVTLQDDGSVTSRGLVIQDDPEERMKPHETVCVLRDGLIVSLYPGQG